MIDLVVVGGGPVGLATALYAHRAGLSVRVLERRGGTGDKACGEGLMPGAVAALADLGVPLPGMPFEGIRYVAGGHAVEARFTGGPGRGVRRTDLHAGLLGKVLAAGVTVERHTVDRVDQGPGYVEVAGIRSRFLAAADGLHSPVRRLVGLEGDPDGSPARFGQRAHFGVEPWTDLVEVHWSEHAEAYVTPVAPDLVGVAVLTTVRAPYDTLLRGFPALVDRLPATPETEVRGAGPLHQRATGRQAGRVLLVGDAAGYVDAITGEGVAVGMAGARALVRCVTANRPDLYEREWRRQSRRYRWITESLLAARRQQRVAGLVVPAAERLPRVFGTLVDQLAR
jgi:flavin-dependent dehydrogenase